MFSETYRRMNEPVGPSPGLVRRTMEETQRRRMPLRRLAVCALAAALCLAAPALAAQTELGYQLLYQLSPAAAQFFQPVRESCTDSGVTMEVAAVRVEGGTAQAYITLSGDVVDSSTDLYDSYSFHLPFDSVNRCEQVGYDPDTHTALFLCTAEAMDGEDIPAGGKMTFSVRKLLSGKTALEDAAVGLELADCALEAETAPTWSNPDEKTPGAFYCTGGDLAECPMLRPGEALAAPTEAMPITAAGYVHGLFHIQVQLKRHLEVDPHCFLWLEGAGGNRLDPVGVVYHTRGEGAEREDYLDQVFDVAPGELAGYTLHGRFISSSTLTEGAWRVTFPLENTEP